MEMPFTGPSYQAISPIIDDEIAMNCFSEVAESPNAASKFALRRTPGRKVFATLPEGKVPFGFTVNGRTFWAGSNLYETNAGGAITNWGSLGATPVAPTMMVANETQLAILNNGNLYVFTFATNTLIAVNMAQFNGPIAQISFCDGYVIATLQNSHTFQQSNLEDATTWQGLNVATLSYFPDNIVSQSVIYRVPWFFSAKRAIGYYNSGAGFPVFIPIQGAQVEHGSGAMSSIVQSADTLLWLEQDDNGAMVARRLDGYTGTRVSTHAVELAWQQFATTSDAIGWSYQQEGHYFACFYFPTANASWCYDVTESKTAGVALWHQRGAWIQAAGIYVADLAMSHTFNFGKHLVGDWSSGNIYWLSSTFYDDAGAMIRGWRRSPTITKENKWIYFDQIEFVMATGLIPSTPLYDGLGQIRPAQIQLRWSNDGGQTWSNWYFLSVGKQGEYNKRVIKRMLGRGRKRLWDVVWTDPYPFAFNGAFLEADGELAKNRKTAS